MGELAPVGEVEDDFDVDVLWQSLPSRSRKTFLHFIKPHAHLKHIEHGWEKQAWPSIMMVVIFGCEHLAESQIGCNIGCEPSKFMWNLWECRDVIHILAADFLSKGREVECLSILCYGAVVDECLARGTKPLLKWTADRPTTNTNEMVTSSVHLGDLLLMFGFVQRALLACKTRKGMLAFTIERLEETVARDEICLTWEEKLSLDQHTDALLKNLRALDCDMSSRGDMHSIDLPSNPTPPPPIELIFQCGAETFEFQLYSQTEFDWLLRLCAARMWNAHYLFHCYKDDTGKLRQPDVGNFEITIGADSVGLGQLYEKTLGQLGYEEGTYESIRSYGSIPSLIEGEHYDVLFHWGKLPVGVKELIYRDLLPIWTLRQKNKPRTLSFKSLSNFMAQSLNYLRVSSNDNESRHFGFNMMQAILSSYWLAGYYIFEWGFMDFDKAIRLIIHATALEEWLALGSICVKLARLDELSKTGKLLFLQNSQHLFIHCLVALNGMTTRHAMAQAVILKLDTLALAADWYMDDCDMDQQRSILNLTDHLTELIYCSPDSECMTANTAIPTTPTHILYLSLLHEGTRLEVAVFRHTSARWLFVLCLAMITGDFKLFKDARSGVRHLQCPIIRNTSTGTKHYVATSGKKTLAELRFEEDDIISIEYSEILKAEAKLKRPKVKRASPPSGLCRSKRAKVPPASRPPSEEDFRREHSDALEPVLHELRPVLKSIRNRHNALLIKRGAPKKTNLPAKRPSATACDMPSAAPLSSRVGKSRYRVLVGEPDNLYKTSKIRLAAPSTEMTLDLHGCSRPEALDLLRCRLASWVELAMRSEYPFVVAADIVCGRGTQELSELVADFIRENSQIANRPKGVAV